jgi:hypothetical protein
LKYVNISASSSPEIIQNFSSLYATQFCAREFYSEYNSEYSWVRRFQEIHSIMLQNSLLKSSLDYLAQLIYSHRLNIPDETKAGWK